MAEPPASLGTLSADRQELLRRLLQKKGVETAALARIPRRPDPAAPAPLSFAQRRLWFLDRLEPGSSRYNVPASVLLPYEVDQEALQAALGLVIRRHEALRTTFVEIAGEPRQVVGPPFVPAVPLVDLAGLPEERVAAESARLVQAETGLPFDLARGPLLRAMLLRLRYAPPVTDLDPAELVDEPPADALVATLHHIVSDGWSCGLLLQEVMTLGETVKTGEPHGLPELPVQYADFAVWQNGQLAGETLGQQLAYWRETLAGVPEALELPYDRPRPAMPSGRGGRRRLAVPPATAQAVRALAGRAEATPFVVLLAGFMGLLGRLAGQERFAVGTVVAGRNREEVAHLIGFFVNTLALPADLCGDPTFEEVVRRTREAANSAFSHQELPFERLVEELQPERVAGRNPLFQVVFALQSTRGPAARTRKAAVELLAVDTGTAKFDLSLSLSETADGWEGELEYAADLFDASTATRLADQLERFFEEATRRPESPLSALPWLEEAERHQLLREWNDTAVAGPAYPSIPAAVGVQVARAPEAVALQQGEAQLTYGELKARAAMLARRLLQAGVGPEVRVGVSLARSPELVLALLAILEAGGAYVPLDLEYPEARLAFMLGAAEVPLVVSSRRFAGHPWLAGSRVPVLLVDAPAGEAALPDGPAAPPLDPANLAFVPFTSGSTGEPKGVAIPHRGLLRLVLEGGYARFDPDGRFLAVSVVSFDASSAEIWGALAHGARLALLPPGAPSIDGLAAELARYEVTTLFLTAGLFHAVVESRPRALSGVRQLFVGGEVLSPEVMRRTLAELPGIGLIACYGPTEVSTFTSTWRAVAAELEHTVPIGRPLGNTRVRVLDSNLTPVPIGVAGELLAGGAGLARGYAGRADSTAERFVPDPAAETPGERLYRTGDRVRWRPDGTLEFLGRFDDQVKVRGFRIEPREIEAALLACPGVAQAAVLATAPRPGESRRLVAFVAGEGLSAAGLGAELRRRLPDFMVPQAFGLLPELPLAPTGKVDRRALTAQVERALAATAEVPDRAPLSTPTEELLAAVWCEVLGVPAVGADDSFFALGGHSLLATRAAALLRDVFGVDVPLRDFFETTDLAGLAGRIDGLRGSGAALGFPPIAPRPEGEPAPLSFAQERLWFLDRLTPEPAIYNVPEAERIHGPFDGAALEAALRGVVERHEILRTRFAQGADGAPLQIVEPVPDLLLPRIDLTGLPASAAEAEMTSWIWREAFRPFDLARSPMLRAVLFRLAPEDHAWGVVRHHIATDGWSAEIFRRELTALYAAALTGSPSPLPPLPVQYADFAAWQRRHLGDEVLAGQLAYWRGQLAGAPPLLELPADQPRPPALGHTGEIRTATVSDGLGEALQALARRHGATRYIVLLAAFETLLTRYTGRADLVVGTPVANRRRAEVQELIGFFANTLALRTDLGGDPTFAEALSRVRATALAAYDHQDLPFERLVEEMNPARDPSYPPLVQILFVQQAQSRRDEARTEPVAPAEPDGKAEPASPAGLAFSRVAGERAMSRFDVELYAFEVGRGLELALEYRTDLYDRPRMERLLGHLTTLLAAVAESADRQLSELPLLSEAERRQILVEWGEGAWPEADGGPLVPERIAARAAADPGALALVAGTERLTYGELDAWAEALADELARAGVGREDRVGVLARRTAALPAALLAIWKAGGAYVALDPAYPPARLLQIAGDARMKALFVGDGLESLLPEGGEVRLPLAEGRGGRRTPIRLLPDQLAYLLYTSGSTGRPKGVAIRHGAAAALVRWALDEYRPQELARVLAATSINFDLSVFELFVPLAAGGTVVLVEDALALPGLGEEVTLVNTVPSVIAEVARRGLPPGIAAINLAGEPLRRELAATLHAQAPGARLFNLYGPSEDTTYSTGVQVEPGTAAEPTIGRALPGSFARVLDAAGEPLPIGVPGELCLGGEGLARGYFGRPDLTALAFVPAAAARRPGERLYRSGDLARWTESGELEFLGRIDHQVKVRGFRIELAEIDMALAAHPALAQAAVVAAGQEEDRRLAAFVVPAEGMGAVAPEDLRAFLKQSLPDYMVPAFFCELAALPLSPSGKVDRRALAGRLEAEGGLPLAGAQAAFSPPEGEIESALAGIWEALLERAPVGRDDSFFDLGGHSLQGVRLLTRIAQTFGVELPLRTVFEAPTLAALAGRIAAVRGAPGGPGGRADLPRIPRAKRGGPLPLSFAQERIWFLHSLAPGSAAYNLPAAFHLRGALDPAALGAAVGEVVRRHEVLRTRYEVVDGAPRALPAAAGEAGLPEVDLSALPNPAGAARELVAREVERPFDLTAGPVVRSLLLKLGPAERAFAFNAHHIVCDGWSLGLWAREVETLYRDFAAGRAPSLPPLPLQYGDFAVWQRQWLSGQEVERQIDWWKETLAGAPARLELPLDRPRVARPGSGGGAVSTLLPAALAARLRALAHGSQASLFMVLLAALATLLGRLAGESDLVIGSPIAGRSRAELEGLIGCFLNTLALRVDLSGNPSFAALLERVRERALGAFAHQDVPFERLLAALNPERDMARTPLFQVLLNVLNTPEARLDLPGLDLSPFPLPEALAKFDLTLYAQEFGDSLGLHLVYAADLFDRARMEELLGQLTGLLEQAAEEPERPVEDLLLLTPSAVALLPDPREPLDRTFRGAVHDLFRQQAARSPEHPALIDAAGAVMSYRELDEASEDLAAHLAARGIGQGDRVALWAHRGPHLVTAILAVLKTGAAYVVFNPLEGGVRLAAKFRLADPRLLLLPGAGPLPAGLAEEARERIVPWPEGEPAPRPRAFPAVGPGDLACISFTSGSTGEPKGVLQAHGSMSYFLPWFAEALALTPADRFSLLSGLAHDPLQRDVFHALAHGATLVVPDPGRIGAPGYLAGLLSEHGVTIAHLTPAMGQLLCDSAAPGASLPQLRWAVFGGDALSAALLERMRRLAPKASFLNLFGATETHRALAAHRVDLPRDAGVAPARALPLGRGIPGSQLLVLSPSGRLAGIGELGQIALRSPHLALGYLGDEELTRERFRSNPFVEGADPGDRLYLTGDLGRFRPDGTVEPAGRADRQIQIRGFRIEPAEIEAVLARLPGVRAAAVRPWMHRGEPRLAAYLTAGEPLDFAALRRQLREALPEALVPAAFLQLDRLPLSPSGKVDLDALPEPPLAPGTQGEDAAPRDALELRLLAIWREVLEVDALGLDDDFFARGGHSLLAVRLLARIAKDFGRQLPLGVLFRATTVRELAALLRDEAAGDFTETPLVRLRDYQEGDGPPLFLLHPLGGQVLAYQPLLRALPPGFAVFALADTFPVEEPRTLDSLAAAYLEEIRREQPHGPYRLAGWSFGGRLAFEMAGQLHNAGETVDFVGLLDTGLAIPEARAATSDAAVLAEVFPDLAAQLAELPEGADPLNELLARGAAAGTLSPGLTPALARRRLDLLKAHYAIAPRDLPRFYPGTVDLFVAAETWPEEAGTDTSHGWAALCQSLVLHRLPGDHLSLMREPHVQELAQRLGERLG